jgi:hypothetical protein
MQDQHGATAAQPNERDDDAETFDVAPVSLWLHDYSALKALFADWKAAGITDLREFLREDPDRIRACSERFRVIRVNRRTLTLFEANDLNHLVENLAGSSATTCSTRSSTSWCSCGKAAANSSVTP